MKFHMTQTMLDLVSAAIEKIDTEHHWVGIDKMRGYFVSSASSTIPSSVAVLAVVERRNAKFIVCMNIVEHLDGVDESQWQTPWGSKDGS